MKKKVALFALVFALILTCASAMAANIKDASAQSGSGATIAKSDDNKSFTVTYNGEKDKEYVVMAVAQSGIDSTVGRPTVDTIGTNEAGVLVYMDQAKANASGKVEFTVRPMEQAKAGEEYAVYISSNVAGSSMAKVGSFTLEATPDSGDSGSGGSGGSGSGDTGDSGNSGSSNILYGDVDGKGQVDGRDLTALARYLADRKDYLPGGSKAINLENANCNGKGGVDGRDLTSLARHLADRQEYAVLPH